MYEQRCIAFIDILGFGALVQESVGSIDLQKMIYEALDSLHSKNINEETYSRVNEEIIPPEELAKVREIAKLFNHALKQAHPVLVTFFSDCLVLSADSNDVLSSQLILDLVAKLSLRLWQDHNLLIRGGITIGELLHKENGPLFGPAMNRAYFLESKEAINPRVLIDKIYLDNYLKAQTAKPLISLINSDEKFSYLSLATAFRHTINDSTEALMGEKVLFRHRQSFATTIERLTKIEKTQSDKKIKSKYAWLIEELKVIASQIRCS
jgi:hypothetical protein